jgi:hypothetical protein
MVFIRTLDSVWRIRKANRADLPSAWFMGLTLLYIHFTLESPFVKRPGKTPQPLDWLLVAGGFDEFSGSFFPFFPPGSVRIQYGLHCRLQVTCGCTGWWPYLVRWQLARRQVGPPNLVRATLPSARTTSMPSSGIRAATNAFMRRRSLWQWSVRSFLASGLWPERRSGFY